MRSAGRGAGRPTPLAEFPWFYDANGGIFNLYQQPYWYALIALVAVAIAVCTVSRSAPIWRTVRRPPRRVNAAYFERARHRYSRDLAAPLPLAESVATVTAALRRRQYRVEQIAEADGTVELFADRFGPGPSWPRSSRISRCCCCLARR